MTRTQPHQATTNQANRLHQLAHQITQAHQHAQHELTQINIYPQPALTEHTAGGDITQTWPPTTIINAIQLRTQLTQLHTWHTQLEQHINHGQHLINTILRTRTGTPPPFDPTQHGATRCSGGDPTCQHWASEHTLTNGSTHNGLCDHCFTLACQTCAKPAQHRRIGPTRACDTCYKQHQRTQTKVAS